MDTASQKRYDNLVTVYNALDEPSANIVKSVLEDAGLPAMVQPCEVSWLDGVLVPAEGRWGEVLVRASQAEQARAILAAYEAQPDEKAD